MSSSIFWVVSLQDILQFDSFVFIYVGLVDNVEVDVLFPNIKKFYTCI